MTDIIGPVVAIAVIFVVYYIAQNMDVLGDTKLAKLDIQKMEAKTRQEEAETRKHEMQAEVGRLAIEARRLDNRLDHNIKGAKDAEYHVLEDKNRDN